MGVRILSYNAQLMKQPFDYLRGLMREKVDFFCLQRISESFARTYEGYSVYQRQFDGSAFGTAILSPRPFKSRCGNLLTRHFTNDSQGHSFTAADLGDWTLVNVLPPFEEAPDVTAEDVQQYLRKIFAQEAHAKAIWVGDFHQEISQLKASLPPDLQNYSREANFLDLNLKPMNLTKLISAQKLRVIENVLPLPIDTPITHKPVLFEVEFIALKASE